MKKNIQIKQIIHYIRDKSNQEDVVKYKVGMQVNLYVEKHIFKHASKSRDTLPKEYYSDVTYNDDLKALVTTLGFNKVKELLYDFSNGIINISEGTINNIYDEFSNKSDSTINNITNNILKEEIHLIEIEYDEILDTAEIQNKEITLTYWKE